MNSRGALPVIIDCDPGVDDAIALLLAFASPELDVRAVTVSAGNVGLTETARNAAGLAALAEYAGPVIAGADRPILGRYTYSAHVNGGDGLAGLAHKLPPGKVASGLAADAIRDMLRGSSDKLTLVGIGPATNFGLALATEPGLAAQVERIVLMSGAWGVGNITPQAEFNAACDPEALAVVLACGAPVILATLELTCQARVTRERLAALRASCVGRAHDFAYGMLSRSLLAVAEGFKLHDVCAVAYLLRPDLFVLRRASIGVVCTPGPLRGRTLIDRQNPGESPHFIMERLDADGFFALLGERLSALPRRA